MNTASHFNLQVKSLQLTILVIQVFVIAIGGSIFGIGAALRPILRLVKPEYFHTIRSICDLMISVGIWQIFSAGLNCLSACWKLIWPLYLAMGFTFLVVLLEMVGMSTSFYVLTHVADVANEDIYRAWFVWECKGVGSCHAAMLDYVHRYMMPQTALAAVAIILQCMTVLYLVRCVRCLQAKQMRIFKSREDLLNISNQSFDSVNSQTRGATLGSASARGSFTGSVLNTLTECVSPKSKESPTGDNLAKYTTPNSILKGDHGYVMASNSSLNFEDNYAGQSQSQSSQKGTPSISFNTSVQVHYFDSERPTSPKYPATMRSPGRNQDRTICVPDEDANNNSPHSHAHAHAHVHPPAVNEPSTSSGPRVCTEAASAAGFCQNVSLKSGDGSSPGSHSSGKYEDASDQLSRILSRVTSSSLRSRKYSFAPATPPPVPPSTPVELGFQSNPSPDQ